MNRIDWIDWEVTGFLFEMEGILKGRISPQEVQEISLRTGIVFKVPLNGKGLGLPSSIALVIDIDVNMS